MKDNKWTKVIDGIQESMVWVLIVMMAVCILALTLFDVLAGTGTMLKLTRDNVQVSVFISLATSGLLMSMMMISYQMISKKKSKASSGIGIWILIVALGISALDVYFDSLTADYLRFNFIVSVRDFPAGLGDRNLHILFRVLMGGISVAGEPLAISIILGMPTLKLIISNALPSTGSKRVGVSQKNKKSTYKPKHKPISLRSPLSKSTIQRFGDLE